MACHTEIKDLRRQITQRAPVSENEATWKIQRLKDQLKEAKKDLWNNVAWKKEDLDKPHTADHIEDALKVAGTFQEERRWLTDEIKWLKMRNE